MKPRIWAAIAAATIGLATPVAGISGTFAWILVNSNLRIQACLRDRPRPVCEIAHSWDSVSFVNLARATWAGHVLAALPMAALAGAIAAKARKDIGTPPLPLEFQARIQRAIEQGLPLEAILEDTYHV